MLTPLRHQRGFTLIEIMVALAIFGLLAALAYPNYVRYLAKSSQVEAKTNLSAIYLAERLYFTEFLRFGGIPQIGYSVAGKTNRYTYRSVSTDSAGAPSPQPGDVVNPVSGPPAAENTTYVAASSQWGFTATATGNIDNDLTIDQWYVNDLKQGLQFATTDDTYF